ncbi:MAG TPA: GNAT family N-acetyltransferase [Solirubrobacteraceae bacterium]|nr:GNAT family N-acetyltransferase [Solirubrobacteraceae bacterium]
MTSLGPGQLRPAGPADAEAVARLHADSWRRHYRGAYSDAFLDGDVERDRLAVWSERLEQVHDSHATFLAENGGMLVGFVHVVFDEDRSWGALIDNIHVDAASQRCGVGTGLMAVAAGAVVERSAPTGLYLWVLEQNVAAQAFYVARGGGRVERAPVVAPGGVSGRLNGHPMKLRFVWTDLRVLVGG